MPHHARVNLPLHSPRPHVCPYRSPPWHAHAEKHFPLAAPESCKVTNCSECSLPPTDSLKSTGGWMGNGSVLNTFFLLAWRAWKPTCLMPARHRNPHHHLGRCSFGTAFPCRTSPSTYLRPNSYTSHWPIRPVRAKLIFPRLPALPLEILCCTVRTNYLRGSVTAQ